MSTNGRLFPAAQTDAESRVRNIYANGIADGWDGRGRCHLIEFTVTATAFSDMVRSLWERAGRRSWRDRNETVYTRDPARRSEIGGFDSTGVWPDAQERAVRLSGVSVWVQSSTFRLLTTGAQAKARTLN